MSVMKTKEELIQFCKALRQNSTDVEKILWYFLRNRNLLNCKFRRQHLIGNYIVDFICIDIKLIIELDGGQHNLRQQYDNNRTNFLNQQGFKVLRYWNNELTMQLESVMNDIVNEVEKLKIDRLKNPHPDPLP